jgi:hypothetical protein
VKATHYSIRTPMDLGANSYNPRSWVVEVLDDGVSWREVSRETDSQDLNGANFSHTFSITNPTLSRFLRIRGMLTHSSCHFLTFQQLENFGDLNE